jgi:putrescine transport system permease protein
MGYAFLFGPIFYVIVYSFNDSRLVGKWSKFSWRWYKELLQNETLLDAFATTLKIGTIVASLSTILGTMSAFYVRKKERLASYTGRILTTLISIPLVMPEVITGLALMLLFIFIEQQLGLGTIRGKISVICAHVTLTTSYVFLMVSAQLTEINKNIEEAAMDLGAKPIYVFTRITFPLILPSIVSAWGLAFTISLDDVILASFVSGPGATTLPILIFSSMRFGMTPEINAIATIIIIFVSTILLLSGIKLYKKNRLITHKNS